MLDREVRQKFWYGSRFETLWMIAPIASKYRDVEGPLGSYAVCDGWLLAPGSWLLAPGG